MVGTPEEQVGYIAADEYTHRLSSPPPSSSGHRGDSKPNVESPLHRSSEISGEKPSIEHTVSSSATHNENGGADVIHIDEPLHHEHHPDGFAPAPEEHDGDKYLEEEEDGENETILAADEVHPGSENLQPAVSPTFERRDSSHLGHDNDSHIHKVHSRSSSAQGSRANSRPASLHGAQNLSRFNSHNEEHEDMHTPLEDVEEYEPLFPDDDGKEREAPSAVDRFKQRPEINQHRFPSRDVWEDTPESLQLEATVTTPELAEESQKGLESSAKPKRKTAVGEQNRLDEEKLQRPDSKQRFPSKDVWEDVPESQQLVTTVQIPAQNEKPQQEKVSSPEVPTKPTIPTRPSKRISEDTAKKPPAIPGRPKPGIPARPIARTSDDNVNKSVSGGSGGSGDISSSIAAKPKPAVPARPGGSKIAALKAGFMTDLNKRLQVGPQEHKPPQKEESEAPAEKVPLSDARKGRARGPARRKPATATATAVEPAAKAQAARTPEIRIVEPWNVWQVGEDGVLVVGGEKTHKTLSPELDALQDTTGIGSTERLDQSTTPRPPDDETPDVTLSSAEIADETQGNSSNSSPADATPPTSSIEEKAAGDITTEKEQVTESDTTTAALESEDDNSDKQEQTASAKLEAEKEPTEST